MYQKNGWRLGAGVAALAALLPVGAAQAQEFPNKPVRLVVGFSPGGTMDVYARMLAKNVQERSKIAMIIDNRPGAGGLVAATHVQQSPADGYTILHIAPSTISKVLVKDVPFDVFKAMQPISSFWHGAFVLTTNTSTPANTAKELVDFVKANPGKYNYGATNAVSALPMILFMSIAGAKMQQIEYKASPQMNQALVTNEIQATFGTLQSVQPQLASGKLKVLMVTGNQRMAAMPNVPTTTEAGFPNVQAYVIGAVLSPPGVPAPIVAKLSAAIKDAVVSAEVEKLLVGNGGKPLVVSNEELMRQLLEEDAMWANAAKVAGFKPQ
jgi:tripartite-type tricarboxylate transporter receptor subunit TctC